MLTIGQLREKLNELEKGWEADDWAEMFGEFDDQQVLVDWYDERPISATKYKGIGPAKIVPYWELGLCIIPDEEERPK